MGKQAPLTEEREGEGRHIGNITRESVGEMTRKRKGLVLSEGFAGKQSEYQRGDSEQPQSGI